MYSRPQSRDADFARLLRSSYASGRPPAPARRSRAVTLSVDPGTEVMEQGGQPFEEYVVERGEPVPAPLATPPAAPGAPAAAPATPDASASTPPAPADTVRTPEAPVAPDPYAAATVPTPSSATPTSPSAPAAPPSVETPAPGGASPSVAPSPAAAPSAPAPAPTAAEPLPAPPALPETSSPEPAFAPSKPSVAEDDLAADMQAILTGRKVFDPSMGGMRDRDGSPPPPPPPVDPAKNEQAIFDRIAESMAYANSFDLGSVELQRRFDRFDEEASRRGAPAPGTAAARRAQAAAGPVHAGQREFIEDLSAIDDTRAAAPAAPAQATPVWGALGAATDRGASVRLGDVGRLAGPDLSRPFFDTGEHVRSGDDVGTVPLRIANVDFTYGDLVAMPDFFENPADLLGASERELTALRGHIRRSAAHYRTSTGNDPVTETDWSTATGGRYLRLAATNYTHFAPPSVIEVSFPQAHGDNRARYAELHQQALRESQRLHLANPSGTPTLESALIVNAFADHFLTDAFASGHLVNKEVVIDAFRREFYHGSSLNAAGQAFFTRVANRAFTGEVARRFSELEQADPTIGIGGVGWHANINSASRFATLLQRAAEQEPEKIANVAVKALHDHLNSTGVMVGNNAGAVPWRLHGDEALESSTLAVMKQAVAQSVADLRDPAILASGADLGALVDRVWRFTPEPTSAGLTVLRTALQTYTTPGSTVLSNAAADLITAQLDQLIAELVGGGHLRRA